MLCLVTPILKYITSASALRMDDRHAYEKLSIRDSARSSKKYGATSSRPSTRHESYAKHFVTKADTLQGVALRYGVTMEQIRRANRLFASDSLFLREHLLIPIAETADGGVASPPSSSSSCERVTSPSYDEDEDVNDFLDKIDAAIATTKADVKKIHRHSEFSEDGGGGGVERRRPAVSRMRQMVNNNGTADVVKMMPQTVVMTQGNKIKTSMQRFQQQQDELFEL